MNQAGKDPDRGNSNGRASNAPGHNVMVAAQQSGQGYTLEVAIPWQDLNISPTPGLLIGLALNANDNDTPGTAVQEVMKSHAAPAILFDVIPGEGTAVYHDIDANRQKLHGAHTRAQIKQRV